MMEFLELELSGYSPTEGGSLAHTGPGPSSGSSPRGCWCPEPGMGGSSESSWSLHGSSIPSAVKKGRGRGRRRRKRAGTL